MKLVLKDLNGIRIQVKVNKSDKFSDLCEKVFREYGVDLDLNGLGLTGQPPSPDMNVLDFIRRSICDNKNNLCDSENTDTDISYQGEELSSLPNIEKDSSATTFEKCRLCAEEKELSNLSPIVRFKDKIKILLQLTIEDATADGLSKKICYDCTEQLESFYTFRKKCLQAEALQNSVIALSRPAETISDPPVVAERKTKTYHCDICYKHFRSKLRLSFHLQLHDNGRVEGCCALCGKEFPSEIGLYRHFVNIHSSRKVYTCTLCGKKLGSKSSLLYHARLHTSLEAMKPCVCNGCGRRFARKSILRDHLIKRHGTGITPNVTVSECSECKELFPTQDDATTHMSIQHGSSTMPLQTFTVSKVFVCEFCDKCFKKSADIRQHRQNHTTPMPYLCKFCNEEFASYATLRTHIDAHIKDGMIDYKTLFQVPVMFTCEFCYASFISYQSFRLHCKSHNQSKPYKCLLCSETFESADEAVTHRNAHGVNLSENSADPLNCHICGKSFTTSSGLTKHYRVHSGEKPFKCPICSKHFSQSSGLSSHMKVHSDVRPYTCDICPKAFKFIGDYKAHVRKHSELKLFTCPICSKSFITQRTLFLHQNAHATSNLLLQTN